MRKIEAERLNNIDITTLKKVGWFKGGSKHIFITPHDNIMEGKILIELEGRKQLHFLYTTVDERGKKHTNDAQIFLATTPCHFGGERYWFECMGINGECKRRVKKLFHYYNQDLCRHCLNLTYASRNENRSRSMSSRLNRYFDLQEKIEKLENRAVRFTWAGIPTKKREQLQKLYMKENVSQNYFERVGVL